MAYNLSHSVYFDFAFTVAGDWQFWQSNSFPVIICQLRHLFCVALHLVIWCWFCLPNGLQDFSKMLRYSHFLSFQHSCMNLVDLWGFHVLKKSNGLLYCFNCRYLKINIQCVFTFEHFWFSSVLEAKYGLFYILP